MAAATAAILLVPDTADACSTASCSLSARPLDARLARGRFQIDVSYRSFEQDRPLLRAAPMPRTLASDPVVFRPGVDFESGRFVPAAHQEWGASARAMQVDVGYGLTSRLSLLASVPLARRSVRHHTAYSGYHDHGAGPPTGGVLTLGGLGDIQLTARYRLGMAWTAGGAVRLASGSNTRLDEQGRIADPMEQPGTGSPGLLASVQYATSLPLGFSGAAAASYQRSFANRLGYRMGDETGVTLRTSRRITSRLTATALVKGWHGARNEYRGQASLSTGGLAVYVAPGLHFSAGRGAAFFASVQLPVYQRVNEMQLGSGLGLTLGVSRSF